MTRCECAELSFDEIARRIGEEGQSLELVQQTTGCGLLCSACVPDLHKLVARLRERPPGDTAAAAGPAPNLPLRAEPG
jgi:bacterioferritin-associated ferredoxin